MGRIVLAALACALLTGCAEKSESQQVTDAVKSEVGQRGKALHIDCIEAPVSTVYGPEADHLPTAWACAATLRHPRTRFANCPTLNFPGERAVAQCSFSRKPGSKEPGVLIIK